MNAALRGARLVGYAPATVTPKKEKGKPVKASSPKKASSRALPPAQKASSLNRHMGAGRLVIGEALAFGALHRGHGAFNVAVAEA